LGSPHLAGGNGDVYVGWDDDAGLGPYGMQWVGRVARVSTTDGTIVGGPVDVGISNATPLSPMPFYDGSGFGVGWMDYEYLDVAGDSSSSIYVQPICF
jgi:hypothetical protein